MTKTLGLAAVLLTALAATLVAPPESADAASGPIGAVRITHDKIGEASVAAGAPVVFTADGKVTPHEGESTSWLIFQWDFGDGATAESGTLFGGDSIVHEVPNTFVNPGVYVVRCTANHGPFRDGAYKYSRTTTLKVTVACAESNPGPKQCGPAIYAPFTGTWTIGHGTLRLVDGASGVSGVLEYDIDDVKTTWDVSGKTKLSKAPETGAAVLKALVDLRPRGGNAGKAGKPAKPAGRLALLLPYEGGYEYREGGATLGGGPIGTLTLSSVLRLAARDAERTATLCAQLKAGRKKTVPGGAVSFVVVIRNQGPACLPRARIATTISIEGGVIQDNFTRPSRVETAGGNDTTLVYGLKSLGKGGKADGFSSVGFVVKVDEDASELKCRVNVADAGGDAFADVELPEDLVICIPVERK
jgi:hypothetical protein